MRAALRRVTAGFCAIGGFSAMVLHAIEEELPRPKGERVLLCVWDGMRPDFITPELTPNLYALAQRGTFFANNHSFYPTTTEVNGAVLATGAFPSRNGITANVEYRPRVDQLQPVAIAALQTVRLIDLVTGGKYLGAPTVAERVQRAGFRTVVAGTKASALLQDRNPVSAKRNGSVILFAGRTYPLTALPPIEKAIGPFPVYADTTTAAEPFTDKLHNDWTTRALNEVLWKESLPPYTVLWLNDPDFSQHFSMPGSLLARLGMAEGDANLGLVLETLKKRALLETTNVLVVSDHGFSTVDRVVNLEEYFTHRGIKAARSFVLPPRRGEVLINNIAGSTGLYAIGNDAPTVQKLVDLLQMSDFAGPIFTRAGLPGTFNLSDVHLDSADAPDVIFSFRWKEGANKYGAPGLMVGDGKYPDYGTHGSFGPADVRNTLVAAGPDIRVGLRSELPSGNIDVAPTILHLLKVGPKPGEPACDGRVLVEALAAAKMVEEKPKITRMQAERQIGKSKWLQYIQTTEYGGKTYFDFGNGESTP